MKTPSLLLALVPALLLTSCYVTPAGGPYSSGGGYRAPAPRPGGSYSGRGHDYDRDRRDHDHDRDDRDGRDHDGRDRDGRDRDGYDRDGRSSSGYRGPGGPPSAGMRLPAGARRVEYRGTTYYTSGSSWYRASGSGYVRVSKPY